MGVHFIAIHRIVYACFMDFFVCILYFTVKKCVKQSSALWAKGFSLGLQERFNLENLSWQFIAKIYYTEKIMLSQ